LKHSHANEIPPNSYLQENQEEYHASVKGILNYLLCAKEFYS